MCLPLKKTHNVYVIILVYYSDTHIQSVLTRFYGKCPVCDLKTESHSLNRMHVFTTQTNRSH